MHEDTVEVTSVDRPDLNGLVTPAHHLACTDVC